MALRGDRFPNARQLAEACEVSRRTVYRDLETLALAGIPVRFRRDHRGYQLSPGFDLPPLNLEEREAVALAVLARRGDPDGLGLDHAARSGLRKLLAVLPGEIRERVQALSQLVGPEDEAAALPVGRRAVRDAIFQALELRVQLRLWWREPGAATVDSTKVSPYRLVFDHSGWHLVGRSSWHREVRAFRLCLIERAELAGDPYEVPPHYRLRPAPASRTSQSEVRLRFAPQAAAEVLDSARHPLRAEVLPEGGLLLHLVLDGGEDVLGWLLRFGDAVEVLDPPDLRERVRLLGERIAHLHAVPQPEAAAFQNV